MAFSLAHCTTQTEESIGATLRETLKKLLAEKETFHGDEDAQRYVDAVIRRYRVLQTAPTPESLIEKRSVFLSELRKHVIEMTVYSFDKPADVSLRLQLVGVPDEEIIKITEAMVQPGDALLGLLITSGVLSSVFLCIKACGGTDGEAGCGTLGVGLGMSLCGGGGGGGHYHGHR